MQSIRAFIRHFASTKRGFTMIELIMVVVVIGMVAMFAIPNYTKSVNKTYVKTGKNNLMIMYSAQKIKNTGGILYQLRVNGGL